MAQFNRYNNPGTKKNERADRQSNHRGEYERNRRKLFATEDTCAICGKRVDMTIKYPHPLSATADHIIPLNKGGHPSDMANLQLAHFQCNRLKSDKIALKEEEEERKGVGNRDLPQSIDWKNYRPDIE